MNLQNIKTVARFECKILRRTPVLTGIAILGLIVIFMLQYFQQGKQYTAFWYMIALPSCLPFINALLFSYLQSFLIILAVSEWRRSETRAETLEALRPRQINNSEYILGKSLGILATILTLNLVSITLSLAIHLFNSDAPFHLRPYIFYLFTFTLPSAISRWDSVRKGEEDNIFPYQEEADVMFNSAQIYEIAVLKQYAEPLLFAVPRDCPEYQEAKRLLKFLEYFLNIPSEAIPKTSLLREFIGGSCFEV